MRATCRWLAAFEFPARMQDNASLQAPLAQLEQLPTETTVPLQLRTHTKPGP